MTTRLTGLIAATYTPLHEDGALNLDQVPKITDQLLAEGVSGLYVCGSTGEGMSLTTAERKAVAEAFVQASGKRVPVVIQVGHNSLADAQDMAAHAQNAQATVVSATAPSYYKVTSVDMLIECMAEIASAAPRLPFYYYHIPSLTGAVVDLVAFLRKAGERIPNLAGVKYTTSTLEEYQQCLALDGGRYDMLWGRDEILHSAWLVGARGAVGSTYNIAAPLYKRILDALREQDIELAGRLQLQAVQMIATIKHYPFHPAMKAIMGMLGLPCGPCRLPQPRLSTADRKHLSSDLERIGFFEWARPSTINVAISDGSSQ